MTSPYSYSADILLSVFTVFLLIAFSAYSWRGRSVPGALPFALACLFTALWAVGSIMEYTAVDLATKISWIKFQSIWQLLANTLITCFVLEFAWPQRWLNRRNLILLLMIPLLNTVAIFFDARYPLPAPGMELGGPILPLYEQRSWLFLAYIYGLGLINLIVFAWLFVHSPRQRWPVVVMATGQVVAGIIFLLQAVGIRYSMFPLEMLAIAVLFFAYAVVRFGLYILSPVPLAHQMALKQMHTGMLVLDAHKRVVSLNSSAEVMLKLSAGRLMSRPIWDLIP